MSIKKEAASLLVEIRILRIKLAELSKDENFYSYMWKKLERTDYLPEDVCDFREVVRDKIVPLLIELREKRGKLAGIDDIRPWDIALNPFGRPIIPNCENTSDALNRAINIIYRVHPPFAQNLLELKNREAFDIEVREGKMNVSYSDYLPMQHLPYVQMQLYCNVNSLHTLFHEIGHTVHHALIPEKDNFWSHFPPFEIREFVAQTFEILALPHIGVFFDESDVKSVPFLFFERALTQVVYYTMLDEFQEWLYTFTGDVDVFKFEEQYLRIMMRYRTGINWNDLDEYVGNGYQITQLFARPFYGIEYAFAWLWALTFVSSDYDEKQILRSLESAMREGYKLSLREFLARVNIPFVASEETIDSTVAYVKEVLIQF